MTIFTDDVCITLLQEYFTPQLICQKIIPNLTASFQDYFCLTHTNKIILFKANPPASSNGIFLAC